MFHHLVSKNLEDKKDDTRKDGVYFFFLKLYVLCTVIIYMERVFWGISGICLTVTLYFNGSSSAGTLYLLSVVKSYINTLVGLTRLSWTELLFIFRLMYSKDMSLGITFIRS